MSISLDEHLPEELKALKDAYREYYPNDEGLLVWDELLAALASTDRMWIVLPNSRNVIKWDKRAAQEMDRKLWERGGARAVRHPCPSSGKVCMD